LGKRLCRAAAWGGVWFVNPVSDQIQYICSAIFEKFEVLAEFKTKSEPSDLGA
jgi:hypothetical protein